MISLYIANINRNLTHEFPNYTAPFWKSVGIQILAVTLYTISFCKIEVLDKKKKVAVKYVRSKVGFNLNIFSYVLIQID